MNKLNFIIEDCSNQMMRIWKKYLDNQNWFFDREPSQDFFIEDTVDLVCQRAASGVRYQGKENLGRLVQDYMSKNRKKFFDSLKK